MKKEEHLDGTKGNIEENTENLEGTKENLEETKENLEGTNENPEYHKDSESRTLECGIGDIRSPYQTHLQLSIFVSW